MEQFIDELDNQVRHLEVTYGDYGQSAIVAVIDPNDRDYYSTMDWIADMESMGYRVDVTKYYDATEQHVEEIEIEIS